MILCVEYILLKTYLCSFSCCVRAYLSYIDFYKSPKYALFPANWKRIMGIW